MYAIVRLPPFGAPRIRAVKKAQKHYREVDFVVTENLRPRLLVETKWSDAAINRGLRYLKVRFPEAAARQISATGSKDYVSVDGIRVSPAVELLKDRVQVRNAIAV
jgi:hypothetical protein